VLTRGLGLLAVLASACGSPGGGGSAHAAPAPADQRRVARMVLMDGDLPGYVVRSTGSEKLKDQLPPRGIRGARLIARLVRANWLASENSTLVDGGARPPIFSDANLFARVSAARRIWKLELQKAPGVQTRWLRPPPGAPAGAAYARLGKGALAEYQLVWREGPVIGLVVVQVPATAKGPAFDPLAIGSTLLRAAHAQSGRIAGVLHSEKAI
jgi:hypothetical protein